MKYVIRGEKIKVTGAIKDYINTKFDRITKYLDGKEVQDIIILIKVKNNLQEVEMTIRTNHFLIRCEEATDDLYKSIDLAIDVIERQIVKNKNKILTKSLKENIHDIILEEEDEDELDNKVVKRKNIEVKPMSEEEAILEMNLLKHDFFIFKDDETFELKVLYKRKDDNYGIIETK